MPRLKRNTVHDELIALEDDELRPLLYRLLSDADYWFLPQDWKSKKASIDDFVIDEAGRLKVTFRVVAMITAFDEDLEQLVGIDMTSEDLTRIRTLVDKIVALRRFRDAKATIKKHADRPL